MDAIAGTTGVIVMTDTQLSVLKRAIATYGREKQLDMVIEEMSELTKAICKFKRKAVSNAHLSESRDVIEETADVMIMIEQIVLMIGNRDGIDAVIGEKIKRLKQKLEPEYASCGDCNDGIHCSVYGHQKNRIRCTNPNSIVSETSAEHAPCAYWNRREVT